MPDAQYAPAFWTSVANTFKDDPAVVFDLFNEPYPDRATSTTAQAWTCWRDGGTCPGIGYEVAGMQDLARRRTGHRRAERDPARRDRLLQRPEPVAGAPADRPGRQSRRRLARLQLQHLRRREPAGTPRSPRSPPKCRSWPGEIGENTCAHALRRPGHEAGSTSTACPISAGPGTPGTAPPARP